MGRTAAGGGTGKPESRGLFRKSAAPERGWGSFGCLQYWFGEREEKDKSCDIRDCCSTFPRCRAEPHEGSWARRDGSCPDTVCGASRNVKNGRKKRSAAGSALLRFVCWFQIWFSSVPASGRKRPYPLSPCGEERPARGHIPQPAGVPPGSGCCGRDPLRPSGH